MYLQVVILVWAKGEANNSGHIYNFYNKLLDVEIELVLITRYMGSPIHY